MHLHVLEWLGAFFDDRCLDGHVELCDGRKNIAPPVSHKVVKARHHPMENPSIHRILIPSAMHSQDQHIRPNKKLHIGSSIAGENILTINPEGDEWALLYGRCELCGRLPDWESKQVSIMFVLTTLPIASPTIASQRILQ